MPVTTDLVPQLQAAVNAYEAENFILQNGARIAARMTTDGFALGDLAVRFCTLYPLAAMAGRRRADYDGPTLRTLADAWNISEKRVSYYHVNAAFYPVAVRDPDVPLSVYDKARRLALAGQAADHLPPGAYFDEADPLQPALALVYAWQDAHLSPSDVDRVQAPGEAEVAAPGVLRLRLHYGEATLIVKALEAFSRVCTADMRHAINNLLAIIRDETLKL